MSIAAWENLSRDKKDLPEPDMVAERCARVFGTPDGKQLLKDFQAVVERPVPETAGDSVLRTREGERIFVRRIEALIAKGNRQVEERAKAQVNKPKA